MARRELIRAYFLGRMEGRCGRLLELCGGDGCFESDFGGFFDELVVLCGAGNVVKVNAELPRVTSLLVDVPEDVHLRLDGLHEFQQSLTVSFLFLAHLVQDAIRRPVSDQDVHLSLVLFDHRLSFLLGKAELPIEELRPFADPEHCQSVDLYSLEVQEMAKALELESFLFCF